MPNSEIEPECCIGEDPAIGEAVPQGLIGLMSLRADAECRQVLSSWHIGQSGTILGVEVNSLEHEGMGLSVGQLRHKSQLLWVC